MKKYVIALIVAISLLFTSCSDNTENLTTEQGPKSYEVFQTKDINEYIAFLDSFDETKYKIIDFYPVEKAINSKGDLYFVWYKAKN